MKNIDTTPEEIVPEATKVAATDAPEIMDEAEREADEPILKSKFASEVGGRNSGRLTAFFDRASGWFGMNAKSDKATSDKAGKPNLPIPVSAKNGLGRGGWTAVGVLLVTLPLLAATLWWALDLTDQLQGYKYNLEQIQKGSISNEREGEFINILTSSKLQVFELKTTDAKPIGSIKLYAADYKQWAFLYGGLVPTTQNNVYTMWVVQLPADGSEPGPNNYHLITSFVNQPGGGHYLIVPESSFPSGFAYGNYSRLIVTEEAGASGKLNQPKGPIRFALDLSKVKLF